MKDNEKKIEAEEFDDLEGSEIITLFDEELGKEVDFEEVAAINYKEKLYVFLTPVEPNDDIGEGEVIIMEAVENDNDDEEETLVPVTDEKLLNEIFDEFQKEMASYDDECGCGECHPSHHDHDGCGGCDGCGE
ncbi:MAG: DUF1292 domain-containing protein [Clostridiales bacterium]|jgi:hypothetical protein|nr:DUF1292 domain-containing protein [Clostridiales bacterium]